MRVSDASTWDVKPLIENSDVISSLPDRSEVGSLSATPAAPIRFSEASMNTGHLIQFG
jgi:hypothetical protein